MNTSWRSMLKTRSLVAFIVLLSFGLSSSLNNEDFPTSKNKLENELWSEGDSSNLRTVGFHRKTLVRNPYTYTDLPSRKNRPPVASITPKPVSTKSTTVLAEPQEKLSTQESSPLPPPSVPLASSPASRRSKSSSVVPFVVGGCLVFLLLVVSAGVFYYKSKKGNTGNPCSMCIFKFNR